MPLKRIHLAASVDAAISVTKGPFSKSCRNQPGPFDALVEPVDGSQPYPYEEATCASW
jgi:hypothetical protein